MNNNVTIDNMSIAELKAALDFVREDINDIEATAKENNMSPEKIAAYQPVKNVENYLFHKLLNLTRDLYKDKAVVKIP
jgi:hypothetical protein